MTLPPKVKKILPYALSIFISFVFVQSLFFKFSGASETVHIFSTLDQWASSTFGIEGLFLAPGIFNAYVIASAELVAAILLLGGLFTKFKILNPIGALMAMGVISGAIFFHLFTPLGVNVQGDGGALFGMAVSVWISSAILILMNKDKLCGLICKKS